MQTGHRIAALVVALAVVALSGCVSLPSPEEMKADIAGYQVPKLPDGGKAMIYVVRPSALGGLIRFNVFVDDQNPESEMGWTRASEYIYFSIPPGEHKIYSKAENWAELAVSAKPGDIIYIQQDPSLGIIMARNSLARVEDYQGKYFVKRLTLGTVLKTEK